MTRSEIVTELRRMALSLEAGDGGDDLAFTVDMLEDLVDRLMVLDGDGQPPVEPHSIGGHPGHGLVDALEALVEAGVVRMEVHPAFWDAWAALFRTFRVEESRDGRMFSPRVFLDEGKVPGHRMQVRPFAPCGDVLCAPCRYVQAQWAHRMPEPSEEHKPNPGLN